MIETTTVDKFFTSYPECKFSPTGYYGEHKDSMTVIFEKGVAAVFSDPKGKYPSVQGFTWKSSRNHAFYELFDSAEIAEKRALRFIEACNTHNETVAKRRRERSKGHNLRIGTLLVASWGYDQTNVDFYRVTRTTKCTVDLVKIGKKIVSDSSVSPNPETELDSFYKGKRCSLDGWVRIDSSRLAHVCTPDSTHYETPWGYGH